LHGIGYVLSYDSGHQQTSPRARGTGAEYAVYDCLVIEGNQLMANDLQRHRLSFFLLERPLFKTGTLKL